MKAKLGLGSIKLGSFKPGMLWPTAAGLALLAAAWMAWSSWSLYSGKQLSEKTETTRRQVADQITALLKPSLSTMDALKKQQPLITALKSNNLVVVKGIVNKSFPGVDAVEIYAPDLAIAYVDPTAFGYGKLGVLEATSQTGRTALAVVKDAGSARLAMAVLITDQAKPLAIIYVRQSLAGMIAAVQGTASGGSYLALRQGHYNIAESGDKAELQFKAEVAAIKLDGTPLRVVAVAPLVATGLFGLGGLGELGMAIVLVLSAGVLLWLPRFLVRTGKVAAPEVNENEGLTLSEMVSAGRIVAPASATPLERAPTAQAPAGPKIEIDRSIFRAYDIRGVVGKTLSEDIARLLGQAIGSAMLDRNQRSIVVGRDGRLSSPALAAALIEGLRKAGREVIDIGQAPTPLVYFGTYHLRTGCGVAVTGSHNPPDYNGFKIVIDGDTLSGEAIQDLYQRITDNRLSRAEMPGLLSQRDLKDDYIARISSDVLIERKLKVVIDCGNGVAGAIAPELLAAIGAQVEPLYCDVDGTFPNHHPDPSDPANMQDLIRAVQSLDADIGLALDGDGDRLGVVTKSGQMIYPDRLLMLFAADVLERNPGACIIYDVKCTSHLATQILRYGGSPLMWKTGHSLIKAKMKESEAELAGEMSGHFFFRERWYGFDDGTYAAARLLEILAARPEDADAIFSALPKAVSTPELKVALPEGEQYRFIESFVAQAKFDGARITTIDGLRADWPDGWGLVRASNTTPVLVLRFEGENQAALTRIQSLFHVQMLAVNPALTLTF